MVRVNNETGRLDDMKGRTEKEGSDPAKDTRADTASRRGKRGSLRGGIGCAEGCACITGSNGSSPARADAT